MPTKNEARIVAVAVPRPLHKTFDYHLPAELPPASIGSRVVVPFGPNHLIGVCVDLISDTDYEGTTKLKHIERVLDIEPALPTELMSLAQWLSRYYHHPLGEVLATMLPNAAGKGKDLTPDAPDIWACNIDHPPSPRAKRQAELYNHLQASGPLTGADIVAAGFSRSLLRHLVNSGSARSSSTSLLPSKQEQPPEPNSDQLAAIRHIEKATNFAVFLLEGVTGSGKTEVYLRAMAPVLGAGRQVLVLVPEIGLTPQTLARFETRFGRAGMLHSNLTDHERLQTWLSCANGNLQIIIGTRSAVFTPFKDLGLIVVDEEHDSSYKQQEGLRYSARDVAIKRAQNSGIPIVLGSATPSLESLYNIEQGRYQHLQLTHRATGAKLPSYHVVDMRGQNQQEGLSLPLETVIRRHLAQHNQVLVFLNRRGFAPTLLCAACGWQANCEACDAKYTLHKSPSKLVCHHCGAKRSVPTQCGGCGQRALMPVGMGTQRSEARLTELFPETPIIRVDRDTTRSNRQLEAHFEQVNSGRSCILLGTQMLAKGHHFPNVTLVAVLNADAGFCSADFRAPERTAQLIVQVAGRAGRAEKPGEVWIQSYQPDNPTLNRLITEGYGGFAQGELADRIAMGLPPAQPMAMLRADALVAADAERFLQSCKQRLQHQHDAKASGLQVLGPVAAPLARLANRSRYQLMLIAPSRPSLHRALETFAPPSGPKSLRFSLDIDPYDAY